MYRRIKKNRFKNGSFFKASSQEKKHKRLLIISKFFSYLLALSFAGSIFIIVVFAYFSKDLPSPNQLTDRSVELSTKIYDKNDDLLYDVYATKNRTLVSLENISPNILKATLATEDSDFYKHRGFDLIGYIRAVFNMLRGGGLQGASTLSQQLVKNALLTTERTVTRKIKEFVLSLQIENKYSKDEILQMYLNEAPYGSTAWGIEAASWLYFNKTAKVLSLAESALIAGLPQSPTAYSPITNPDNAMDRQKYVLRLMRQRGWINSSGQKEFLTEDDYNNALAEDLVFAEGSTTLKAPHFVMYVRQKLIDLFGEDLVENGGLRVKTTLDYKFHNEAQKIVFEEVERASNLLVGNSALVAMDTKTGAIISMVGSRDFFDTDRDGQVNVTLSLRQPGSAIKPITYATGLKQSYTASAVLFDVPTNFPQDAPRPDYVPVNYDGLYRGPIQARYALAQSVNITAVKMLRLVGIKNMIDTANSLGISSLVYDPSKYGLALTLGGGEVRLVELVNAFATFGNEGIYNPFYTIEEVLDKDGNVIYKHQLESRKVLDEGVAFIISDILSDNSARSPVFGFNSELNITGFTVAVKTGTTNDIRDNWTVGYTPLIAIGVWAGNNDNSPMHSSLASGVTGAAPIWNRAMREYLKNFQDEKFKQPEDVIKVGVGKITGMKPFSDIEDTRWEYFIKGTEPASYSNWIQELEICEDDDKLANDDCRDDDRTDFRTYIRFTSQLPDWQEGVDAWVEEKYDDERYFPPNEISDYEKDK